MCGYFSFYPDGLIDTFSHIFDVEQLPNRVKEEDLVSFKFHPKGVIPTISRNSPNKIVMRYWSLIPRWWKEDPYKIPFATFNARVEDISLKASFRKPWSEALRCLVPANWFYEFGTVLDGKVKLKIPYMVSVKNNPNIALGGIYETWLDKQGQVIESVAILTTKAVEPLSQVHERQPVIVDKDNFDLWLNKETNIREVEDLLVPRSDLIVTQLDRDFNKMRAEDLEKEYFRD